MFNPIQALKRSTADNRSTADKRPGSTNDTDTSTIQPTTRREKALAKILDRGPQKSVPGSAAPVPGASTAPQGFREPASAAKGIVAGCRLPRTKLTVLGRNLVAYAPPEDPIKVWVSGENEPYTLKDSEGDDVRVEAASANTVCAMSTQGVSFWKLSPETRSPSPFSVPHSMVSRVVMTPDGRLAASLDNNNVVYSSLETGQNVKWEIPHAGNLAISDDGQQVATCPQSEPGLDLWRPRLDGTFGACIHLDDESRFRSVAFSPNGSLLAARTLRNDIVEACDLTTGSAVRLPQQLKSPSFNEFTPFSLDSRYLAGIEKDTVLLVEPALNKVHQFKYAGDIGKIQFSPDRVMAWRTSPRKPSDPRDSNSSFCIWSLAPASFGKVLANIVLEGNQEATLEPDGEHVLVTGDESVVRYKIQAETPEAIQETNRYGMTD